MRNSYIWKGFTISVNSHPYIITLHLPLSEQKYCGVVLLRSGYYRTKENLTEVVMKNYYRTKGDYKKSYAVAKDVSKFVDVLVIKKYGI